jgi:hypothetical protein
MMTKPNTLDLIKNAYKASLNQRLATEVNNYREKFNVQKNNMTSVFLNTPMSRPERDTSEEY